MRKPNYLKYLSMKRQVFIDELRRQSETIWDIVVIGGGATGLGVALDGASRGYKTLLLEQSDFAKGTSSRSTKLVHGGVRYLAQGDLALVVEALHERGLMLKNAPHLTYNQEFVIPIYNSWDAFIYTVGLKFYDLLAGPLSMGKSYFISREKTLMRLPMLNSKGLHGMMLLPSEPKAAHSTRSPSIHLLTTARSILFFKLLKNTSKSNHDAKIS